MWWRVARKLRFAFPVTLHERPDDQDEDLDSFGHSRAAGGDSPQSVRKSRGTGPKVQLGSSRETRPQGFRVRVLIAEDDTMSRTPLKNAVEGFGHECLAAEDGEKAWELFQNTLEVDVVISDWMMPGMDGLELRQRGEVQAPDPARHLERGDLGEVRRI